MRMNVKQREERMWERVVAEGADAVTFAISEQDRREGPLVEALRSIGHGKISVRGGTLADVELVARQALAQWEALDAKPEPTVAECTREAIEAWDAYDRTDEKLARLNRALIALKAAVEREESKR